VIGRQEPKHMNVKISLKETIYRLKGRALAGRSKTPIAGCDD